MKMSGNLNAVNFDGTFIFAKTNDCHFVNFQDSQWRQFLQISTFLFTDLERTVYNTFYSTVDCYTYSYGHTYAGVDIITHPCPNLNIGFANHF